MAEICPICEGAGLRVIERGGRQFAEDCECRVQQRAERRLRYANIPRRYAGCLLENYETHLPWSNEKLEAAHLKARKFVEGYPLETNGRGLLMTGSVGVGKTHLAVGILKALITERGATGLFFDYRDLLKQIQHSYNPQVATTELQILEPVFNAEVLVLDELGAIRPTDWVWDTVAHILNTRYNDCRTTIITTNLPNLPALTRDEAVRMSDPQRAGRAATLGDRIGDSMRSRLHEMCLVVDMQGEDFRQRVKRASFA
jgi:DNA replication protein DnaC